ncbi:hypothetical protein NLJ89_g6547 [Agrocybe chaxingu]|uniref:Uncharacterized protein n=1 Tax=Agrocybe chaxingu TaxID=84603 RepID=A0A9W8K683_9AGAR|nr:hypothetical protein NLJ89_g6547 [Agrocybe chaxingu]
MPLEWIPHNEEERRDHSVRVINLSVEGRPTFPEYPEQPNLDLLARQFEEHLRWEAPVTDPDPSDAVGTPHQLLRTPVARKMYRSESRRAESRRSPSPEPPGSPISELLERRRPQQTTEDLGLNRSIFSSAADKVHNENQRQLRHYLTSVLVAPVSDEELQKAILTIVNCLQPVDVIRAVHSLGGKGFVEPLITVVETCYSISIGKKMELGVDVRNFIRAKESTATEADVKPDAAGVKPPDAATAKPQDATTAKPQDATTAKPPDATKAKPTEEAKPGSITAPPQAPKPTTKGTSISAPSKPSKPRQPFYVLPSQFSNSPWHLEDIKPPKPNHQSFSLKTAPKNPAHYALIFHNANGKTPYTLESPGYITRNQGTAFKWFISEDTTLLDPQGRYTTVPKNASPGDLHFHRVTTDADVVMYVWLLTISKTWRNISEYYSTIFEGEPLQHPTAVAFLGARPKDRTPTWVQRQRWKELAKDMAAAAPSGGGDDDDEEEEEVAVGGEATQGEAVASA